MHGNRPTGSPSRTHIASPMVSADAEPCTREYSGRADMDAIRRGPTSGDSSAAHIVLQGASDPELCTPAADAIQWAAAPLEAAEQLDAIAEQPVRSDSPPTGQALAVALQSMVMSAPLVTNSRSGSPTVSTATPNDASCPLGSTCQAVGVSKAFRPPAVNEATTPDARHQAAAAAAVEAVAASMDTGTGMSGERAANGCPRAMPVPATHASLLMGRDACMSRSHATISTAKHGQPRQAEPHPKAHRSPNAIPPVVQGRVRHASVYDQLRALHPPAPSRLATRCASVA